MVLNFCNSLILKAFKLVLDKNLFDIIGVIKLNLDLWDYKNNRDKVKYHDQGFEDEIRKRVVLSLINCVSHEEIKVYSNEKVNIKGININGKPDFCIISNDSEIKEIAEFKIAKNKQTDFIVKDIKKLTNMKANLKIMIVLHIIENDEINKIKNKNEEFYGDFTELKGMSLNDKELVLRYKFICER